MTRQVLVAACVLTLFIVAMLSGCSESDSTAAVPDAAPTAPVASPEPQPASPAIDGLIAADEYDRQTTVTGVKIAWSIEGETVRMALSATCEGYISVGFDPERRKEGGNYIIGYVTDSDVVVRDHVGTRGNLHEADVDLGGVDNILAFAGTEMDGQTTLEFIIPLDSGDAYDRPLVPGTTYVVLVAVQDTRDDLISVHSRHGIAQIEL